MPKNKFKCSIITTSLEAIRPDTGNYLVLILLLTMINFNKNFDIVGGIVRVLYTSYFRVIHRKLLLTSHGSVVCFK